MWLIIGIVLVVLWLGGFLVFHTAGFLIHILLILAVISIIFHFLARRVARRLDRDGYMTNRGAYRASRMLIRRSGAG